LPKAELGMRRLALSLKTLRAVNDPLGAGRSRPRGEIMPLALQESLKRRLVRQSLSAVADAFCHTRLDGDWGHASGTLPRGFDTDAIADCGRIA
jgi:putative acyl-CoA dehydrogenase